MLLIGDIHITSRYQDKILQEITNFVNKYPEEKNIVFLGDYVYHFSYDRKAILALYTLLIELFEKGKNIYILAGNHDRLGNSFVFEEAQKAFEIINNLSIGQEGKLQFLTHIKLETIEGKEILFLPHYLETNNNESKISNKNEAYSEKLNKEILSYIEKNPNLIIIHHHYFEGVNFPGQKARFGYKDIAIDNRFLDMKNLKFISGHLHQPFSFKNYFCTGSLRNTSPLEENQIKILCKYDTKLDRLIADEITINPYISIFLENDSLSEESLIKQIKDIKNNNLKLLNDSSLRNIDLIEKDIKLNEISLTIKSENINYENFKTQLKNDIQNKIKDLKIKKNIKNLEELEGKLDLSGKNLSTGFADWKELLKDYLKHKYPTNFQDYEEMLKKLKLFQ